MAVLKFLKKYKVEALRILAAAVLCGIVALFAYMYDSGILPYSHDGEAFDTIYAAEEIE